MKLIPAWSENINDVNKYNSEWKRNIKKIDNGCEMS